MKFNVNKVHSPQARGLFYAMLRHKRVLRPYSVANPPLRRNKSMKNMRYFLERGQNRCTFAS